MLSYFENHLILNYKHISICYLSFHSTAFVGPELVQQLDAAVEEALSAEHW